MYSPGIGWVRPFGDLGVGLSRRLAAAHTGQLGQYLLVSILGIALVLLLGLLSSMVGVSATLPIPGLRS